MLKKLRNKLIRCCIFFGIIYFLMLIFAPNILKLTIDYALFKIEKDKVTKISDYDFVIKGNKLELLNLNIEKDGFYLAVNKITFSLSFFNLFTIPEVDIDEMAIVIERDSQGNYPRSLIVRSLIPNIKIKKLLISSKFMSDRVQNIRLENTQINDNDNLYLNIDRIFFANEGTGFMSLEGVISRHNVVLNMFDKDNYIKIQTNMKGSSSAELDLHLTNYNNISINQLKTLFGINSVDFRGDFNIQFTAEQTRHSFNNFIISSTILPMNLQLNGKDENIEVIDLNDAGNKGKISWQLGRGYHLEIKEFILPVFGGSAEIASGNFNLSAGNNIVPVILKNINLARACQIDGFTAHGLPGGEASLDLNKMEVTKLVLKPEGKDFISYKGDITNLLQPLLPAPPLGALREFYYSKIEISLSPKITDHKHNRSSLSILLHRLDGKPKDIEFLVPVNW